MKNIKKTICVLFAVFVFISSFSVLSFAAEADVADRPLGDQVYKVEFVSSLDEKEGTIYVPNSHIKIYNIPEGSAASSELVADKYLYKAVSTDKDGKAEISVEPGSYVVKEENFKYNDKEYQAELVTLNITEKANYFTVYLKHSVVTKEKEKEDDPKNPFTGDNAAPIYIAIAIVGVSIVLVVLLGRKEKKEKTDKAENNSKE